MKIAFTGSIGVGKTTLVEAMRRHDEFRCFKFIPSAAALCKTKPHEDQIKHNVQRQLALQDLYGASDNTVIDRYFADRLAWEILWPTPDFGVHLALVSDATMWIEKTKHDVLLFYLPAYEFGFGGDSTSPMRDPKRRQEMDEMIGDLLRAFRVPMVVCTGSVEERVTLIRKVYEKVCKEKQCPP